MLEFEPQAHEYRWDGVVVPSVTTVIDGVFKSYAGVPKQTLQRAQERGTAVHEACELHDHGALEMADLDPELYPYVSAWMQFCNESKPVWLDIEKRLFHKTHRFAGTPDRVCILNREVWVIDIKSMVPQKHARLQTAAYLEMVKQENKKAARRGTLSVLGNGTYKLIPHDDSGDWRRFLSTLDLYRWSKS